MVDRDFFLKFETKTFIQELSLFSSIIKPTQDVVSRSVLFELVSLNGITVLYYYAYDGIVGARVSHVFHNHEIDSQLKFVLDYESLVRVLKMCGESVCLVCRSNSFYLDFDGGSVYIPSFDIKKERILCSSFDDSQIIYTEIVDNFDPSVFGSAKTFLNSNQAGYSSDLDFMFIKDGNILLSNGYAVVSFPGFSGINTAIRKSDISLFESFFGIAEGRVSMGSLGSNLYFTVGDKATIFLPKCNEIFPRSYEDFLMEGLDARKCIEIDFNRFFNIMFMFSNIYNSSGAIALKLVSGVLSMESTTSDNKVSSVNVGEFSSRAEAIVFFGTENALASLKCIKQISDKFNLVISSESFSLSGNGIKAVVFGTNQMVRSVMGRMVG